MTIWQELVSVALSFEAVAAFGSIGWIFAILCIFIKFDKKKDSKMCMIGDVVKSTFSAVTFIGVITLSVQFSIYLQNSQVAQIEEQKHVASMVKMQDQIVTAITRPTLHKAETIAQAIDTTVERTGRISNEGLTEIILNAFGEATMDGVLFQTIGKGVEVKCHDWGDGGGLECESNRH